VNQTPSPTLPTRGRENLEAVIFDYGLTLIYFDEQPHSGLVEAYERINRLLAKTLEREIPSAEVLIEKLSKAVDADIQRDYEAGRPEEVEIGGIYDAALRRIGFELEPDVIEEIMALEQRGWLNVVHVGPDVVPTLRTLRDLGLRLGLVSNAAFRPRLMLEQLEAVGLKDYFDAITFSSEVGLRKPHPSIYADALGKLGVDARTALFVGDRLREDVEGPLRLGMRAVLLREWRQENDPGRADFVIQRLGELVPIVRQLRAGAPQTT
jgi:putative hydrolase of the HAD superfamily